MPETVAKRPTPGPSESSAMPQGIQSSTDRRGGCFKIIPKLKRELFTKSACVAGVKSPNPLSHGVGTFHWKPSRQGKCRFGSRNGMHFEKYSSQSEYLSAAPPSEQFWTNDCIIPRGRGGTGRAQRHVVKGVYRKSIHLALTP